MVSEKEGRQIHAVSTRISDAVYQMMEEVITRDLHVSNSDFLRDAIKFYIRQRWPDIYAKYSGEKIEGE